MEKAKRFLSVLIIILALLLPYTALAVEEDPYVRNVTTTITAAK